jgi:hypothetical protein
MAASGNDSAGADCRERGRRFKWRGAMNERMVVPVARQSDQKKAA